MKVGDLVTLSTYALCSEPMWRWKRKIWNEKQSLVGLVVKIEANPNIRSWTSKNESTLLLYQLDAERWPSKPMEHNHSRPIHWQVAGLFPA